MHAGTMQITMLDFFGLQNLNKTGVSHLQTMYIYNVYINSRKNVLRTLFQRIYQLHLIFFYIQHSVLKIWTYTSIQFEVQTKGARSFKRVAVEAIIYAHLFLWMNRPKTWKIDRNVVEVNKCIWKNDEEKRL